MIVFAVSPLARAAAAVLGSLAIGLAAPAFAKDSAHAAADDAYKSARQQCDSMSGNAKDVCVAEAKAERDKAKAQADADAKGTPKARYHAQMTAAKSDYKVAEEKCDAQSGNAKDVCEKEAKAARDKAEADAKATRDTRDARHDASETKNEADYNVAKEKCDAMSGNAKDACLDRAKARYHQ